MGRLIDADVLIEAMTDVYKKHYAGDVSASGFTIAMEMVRKQPTAYDIEKVAAELEEAKEKIATEDYCRTKNYIENDCANKSCFKCCAEYLIGIVRKGGVE